MEYLHPNRALEDIMGGAHEAIPPYHLPQQYLIYSTNKYLQRARHRAITDPAQQDLRVYRSTESIHLAGILP